MNIYVITNNNFMLVGLKCMFSDNSLSVNRVVFSRVSDIAFSNSDVVIVESEGFVNGMVASHLLCHSGTINRHSLNGALLS